MPQPNNDLTFITNEPDHSLLDRFNSLIKDTQKFDILVAYFFISGFYSIYPSLENTEKIRILIGINTETRIADLITEAQREQQLELIFSHAESKQAVEKQIENEMGESQDNKYIEDGVLKFIEWIKSGKLEIKAYPSQNIHAKLYIMGFKEGDRDTGRVITGSSNLTKAGLVDNLEFNVELKNSTDYFFAKDKFKELWEDAVDVSDKYIETVETKTWLNQNILPYHLYLKFLYEYFKDDLNQAGDIFANYFPDNFMRLEYQEQAVLNAKKILEQYGGVFISDVVGLGKTYISTLLVGQLDGRTLVIAPPVLLDSDNPGSWPNALSDFKVPADCESVGKLDDILKKGVEKYTNIIIDEAHRFRSESNITYEKLAEICRGKRVILVTATPYNNSPQDILSQIKLFQNSRKSTIPNLPDLESFFRQLEKKLKNLDRQKDNAEYIRVVKENSKEIREKVLKYLMVRRTRSEVVKYFREDLNNQQLKFPEINNPLPLYYLLNEQEDSIFNSTIELISQEFKYARYTPMLYYKGPIDQLERQSQKNMGSFMKILLVKRLESSFFAFKNSIDRFIHSYEMFIKAFDKGNVYVSKKYTNKIFELLEKDDDQAVQRLIDEEKADCFDSKDFTDNFLDDLKSDLEILQNIKYLWAGVERDPKLSHLLDLLTNNDLLKTNKLVLFTESKETADYLTEKINRKFPNTALCFNGGSTEAIRDQVIENFDGKAKHQKDTYRILISTEVLSEGVNLHRSNVVINYDIPWNPTRLMQRVGRINRVDTKFDTIYTFTFFPTRQSNDEIKLQEAAEVKINAFLTLLGGDAALLTEGEPIGSHELFDRLVSKKTLTGEDEDEVSELKYLTQIKDIRDNNSILFEKIKWLPQKARSGKAGDYNTASLITFFRKGKVQKFFQTTEDLKTFELDFLTAAEVLETSPDEAKIGIPKSYFELLDKNKTFFTVATTDEMIEMQMNKGKDNATQLLRLLKAVYKNTQKLTDDQEDYINKLRRRLEEGGLPKQTTKSAMRALNNLGNQMLDPLKVLAVLQTSISPMLLESHLAAQKPGSTGKREVILSIYLAGK